MGGLKRGAAPILGGNEESYTDPLPQALILTAIVISFGVTAFFLVLAYRSYQELGTDNVEEMRGSEKDD
jgi:multicomponent Na+:H+ antiporter subunit C